MSPCISILLLLSSSCWNRL